MATSADQRSPELVTEETPATILDAEIAAQFVMAEVTGNVIHLEGGRIVPGCVNTADGPIALALLEGLDADGESSGRALLATPEFMVYLGSTMPKVPTEIRPLSAVDYECRHSHAFSSYVFGLEALARHRRVTFRSLVINDSSCHELLTWQLLEALLSFTPDRSFVGRIEDGFKNPPCRATAGLGGIGLSASQSVSSHHFPPGSGFGPKVMVSAEAQQKVQDLIQAAA